MNRPDSHYYRLIKMLRTYILMVLNCLLTTAVFSDSALAADVYKYKDDKGVWHFSERASGHQSEQKFQVRSSNEKRTFKDVWVKQHSGAIPALSIINKYHGPIQAKVSMECKGCKTRTKTADVIVAANSTEFARRFETKRKSWSIKYKMEIVLGDPTTKPDENFKYRLPFPELTEYQITQSFNGPFSHQDEQNLHAIDVAMPIATQVLAARGGTVMAVEESNTETGTDDSYASKANTVYVLHSDGTIGVYAHLDMFSVQVETGDSVKMGEMLARSGNTGFSTGPHLHFTIWHNDNGVQRTVEHAFDDGDGGSFVPLGGQSLSYGYGKVKIKVLESQRDYYKVSQKHLAKLEKSGLENGEQDIEVSLLDQVINTGMTYIRTFQQMLADRSNQ